MTPDAHLGLTEEHLSTWTDNRFGQGVSWRMHRAMISDWQAMVDAATRDGVALIPISSFRDFNRQAMIFNEKALGKRPVLSDDGSALMREDFDDESWLHKILRFSALPGLSRHHWGTEADVFDARAVQQGYRPKLLASEFCTDGPCAELDRWLSARAADYGFFRPYRQDMGGVAPEPWHLSYAPLSRHCLAEFPLDQWTKKLREHDVVFSSIILEHQSELFERYACRISAP